MACEFFVFGLMLTRVFYMRTEEKNRPFSNFQRDVRVIILQVFLVSMVINILMLAGPLYMLQVYDRVLASQSIQTLIALTVLIVALYIFLVLFDILRSVIMNRVSGMLEKEIAASAFRANAYLSVLSSDQQTRLTPVRDLDQCRSFLSGPGPLALLDLPWAPFYFAILFMIHPFLGTVALAAAGFLFVVMLTGDFVGKRSARKTVQYTTKRNLLATATRASPEATLGMGMLGNLERMWNAQTEKLLESEIEGADRASSFTAISKGTRMMLQSGTLGMGAYLAIRGQISPGMMIAASILTARALAPLEQTISTWRSLVLARQAKARLEKSLAKLQDTNTSSYLIAPSKKLVVENLFAGPDLNTPAIKGVSFQVQAGDGLGIIGPSGCGKTTLVRAILGVWPALNGSVRLDGATLDQWPQDVIGESIGFLPQNVDLFDGTIGQNIARFAPEAPSDKILVAAQLAGVHEMITSLPDGYDTMLGEGAFQLSAGQRQRLGLARALYDDPFLVVLDEPNSNLDSEGNTLLLQAISNVRNRGGIVLVVAHRPSALSSVDHLLVLKDGRQEAFGEKNAILGIKTSSFRSRRDKLKLGVAGRETG